VYQGFGEIVLTLSSEWDLTVESVCFCYEIAQCHNPKEGSKNEHLRPNLKCPFSLGFVGHPWSVRTDHDQRHYHHVPTVNERLLLLLQLIGSC
jgi:hypothetical protein